MVAPFVIRAADAAAIADHLDAFAGLLNACVHAGASISFILPHTLADSRAFWRNDVAPAVAAGTRVLLVAHQADAIIGSVQLDLAMPPNQAHRAEVKKLLVHPDARRRGVARALMAELEQQAHAHRRTLITLDTVPTSPAKPLYASLGYAVAGTIPNFARDPREPRFDPTTYMYKTI